MCASGLGSQLGREMKHQGFSLAGNIVIHQHKCVRGVPGGLLSEECRAEDLSKGTSTKQVGR